MERPRREDYVFATVACACILLLGIPLGVLVFRLQEQLAPSDSFLFGATPIGSLMLAVPMALLIIVTTLTFSKDIADRIRPLLRMAPADPLMGPAMTAWTASMSWRLIAAISVAVLLAIAGKGFGSYFYVSESGLSVRPPSEFSLRHYRWEDVASVSIRCRTTRKGRGFRYVLRMSDGYDIDFSRVPTRRFDEAFERISSRLDSLSGARYEFDVSEQALVALGSEHGAASLENAIRSQVLKHGGVLQH